MVDLQHILQVGEVQPAQDEHPFVALVNELQELDWVEGRVLLEKGHHPAKYTLHGHKLRFFKELKTRG